MQIWLIALCVMILAVIMSISVAFMTQAASWAVYLLIAAAIVAVALGAATPFITSVEKDYKNVAKISSNSVHSAKQHTRNALTTVDNTFKKVF